MGRKALDLLTMGGSFLLTKVYYKLNKKSVYRFINNAYDNLLFVLKDVGDATESKALDEAVEILYQAYDALKSFDASGAVLDSLRRMSPSKKLIETVFCCCCKERQFKMDKLESVKGIRNTIPKSALASKETLRAYILEMVDEFDVNGDGIVDEAEVQLALGKYAEDIKKQKDIIFNQTAQFREAMKLLGVEGDEMIDGIFKTFESFMKEKLKEKEFRELYLHNDKIIIKNQKRKKMKKRSALAL